MNGPPATSILVLTEDSGADGFETIEEMVFAILRKIAPTASLEQIEIKSWLYQNTDEATRICHEKYAGRDAEQFETWATQRHLLDEVPQPKDSICLGNKHNHRLAATNFPFDVVYAVGKSLKHAVDQFKVCDDLKVALTPPS